MEAVRGGVAFLGDVGGVQAGAVIGGRASFAGEVEADGEIGERGDFQVDGIADALHAGTQDAAGLAVEGEGAVGTGDDRGVFGAQRDVRRADGQRGAIEGVFHLDADAVAADAGARDHADGLVLESRGTGRRLRGRIGRGLRTQERLRGGPGGHPVGGRSGRIANGASSRISVQRNFMAGFLLFVEDTTAIVRWHRNFERNSSPPR